MGDLAESFAARAEHDERSAKVWYYREAFRTAPHLLLDGLRSAAGHHRVAILKAVGYGAIVTISTAVVFFVIVLLVARATGACCPVSQAAPGVVWMTVLFGGVSLSFGLGAYWLARCATRAFVLSTSLLIVASPAVIQFLLYLDNSSANLETRIILSIMAMIGAILGSLHYARRAAALRQGEIA
jgi:hypothetical protein